MNEPATSSSGARQRTVHPAVMAVAALVLIGAGAAGAWIFRAREGRQGPTRDAGPPPMPGDVRLGRLLYYANCQGCHGPEGHGDGAAAAGMRPPPRDFATAPWKFGATAAAVGRVMRDGSPGTAMPGYGLLSEDERAALTAFVLSLAPEEAKSPPRLSADVCDRLRRLGFVPEETPALAPELDLRDLDGMALSWQRGRGKVVLLNFWGTTCVSCLKELPALEKLGRDVGAGFLVVSVCFDETDPGAVRRLVDGRVAELPVYVNPDGLARARYDVQAMPSLYLIDPAGRLIAHSNGGREWSASAVRDLIRVLNE